jgi:hypothetical protein
MLEYDLGVQDDNKEAVATVVGKLFGHHIFQTLRTEMQVRLCRHKTCLFLIFCAARLHCARLVQHALQGPARLLLCATLACFLLSEHHCSFSNPLQIGYQRVLVQSSLHPPSHVAERVLAAADVFAKELMEMPESAIAETAQAFANTMREPDQTVHLKSERVAVEVQLFCMPPIECNDSVQCRCLIELFVFHVDKKWLKSLSE